MRVRVLVIPVGIIVLLIGFVWFLQGIGVLPGSFMTGSSFWAFAGALAAMIGLLLIGWCEVQNRAPEIRQQNKEATRKIPSAVPRKP
jgi:hypothetical protein